MSKHTELCGQGIRAVAGALAAVVVVLCIPGGCTPGTTETSSDGDGAVAGGVFETGRRPAPADAPAAPAPDGEPSTPEAAEGGDSGSSGGDPCADECGPSGALVCQDGGPPAFHVCGNWDDDPCLEPGAPNPCAEGLVCQAGQCAPPPAPCSDECPGLGETKCAAGGAALLECGQYDPDGCLEWSPAATATCGKDEVCDGGECVPSCIEPDDECEDYDDCCDYPDQKYHCCPILHICVEDWWD